MTKQKRRGVRSHSASRRGLGQFSKLPFPIDVAEKLGYWITCFPEVFAWYENGVYRGHTLKQQDAGWLLIVRATIQGKKKVTFHAAATPAECLLSLGTAIKHGEIEWRDDLY